MDSTLQQTDERSIWLCFQTLGYQLQTPFSQPPDVQLEKCQRLSVRELPEDCETRPTFIPSALLEGVMSI